MVGGLQRQAGLAHAARPDQREQATVGVVEPLGDVGQFRRPPDEGGQLNGQVVRRLRWRGQRFGFDFPAQRLRSRRRRDAQFRFQGAAARLVLGQGGAALAAQRQCAHQLLVRFFPPGLQFHLPPGVALYGVPFPPLRVAGGQAVQHLNGLSVQRFALQQEPLFKRGTIQKEPGQQVAAIQGRGLAQALLACAAGLEMAVGVLSAGGDEVAEGGYIEPVVAARVELDGRAGDEEEGRIGLRVANGAAQAVEGLAEGVQGVGLGLFGPEEGGEGRPREGGAGVHRQVGQQRAGRVGFKIGNRFTAPGDLKSPQERDVQVFHFRRSS